MYIIYDRLGQPRATKLPRSHNQQSADLCQPGSSNLENSTAFPLMFEAMNTSGKYNSTILQFDLSLLLDYSENQL